MLGATRRFGVAQVLRASAPRTLSSRWTPQVLKWQPRLTPSPILSKPFHTSFPALRDASAQAQAAQPGQGEEIITEFKDLQTKGLIDPTIIRNITDPARMGLKTMTEVQSQTIHQMLHGDDILAQAKTGTGKTLAFLAPTLQNILNDPTIKKESTRQRGRFAESTDIRALIISPTRELAEQIAAEAIKVAANTGLIVQTAVGGTQKRAGLMRIQRQGCHLLVGTPGRLKDIFSDSYSGVSAPNLNTLILDEADRLLDQGFSAEIEEIQTLLPDPFKVDRQTLMFSATVPKGVMQMVNRTMKPDFKFVKTVREDETPTHLTVPQKLVFMRGYENAMPAVLEVAKQYQERREQNPELRPFRAIVYFNSTSEVQLAAQAFKNLRVDRTDSRPRSPLGRVRFLEIHSRLSQNQRTWNADTFRRCDEAILFSSDVTARGMDFPDVTHVIQVGIPRDRETYIHRLGRTARANKKGEGWIFLHDAEFEGYRKKLYDLPLVKDQESVPSATVDMSKNLDLSAPGHQIAAQMKEALSGVPAGERAAAIRSLLGIFVPNFSDRGRVVEVLDDLAVHGYNLPEPPVHSPTVLWNMGLTNTRGLRAGDVQPRHLAGHSRRGSDRGFSRDFARGPNRSSGRGQSRYSDSGFAFPRSSSMNGPRSRY
ncbi:ATP-dependent RNA helicase [Penicillium capsulatum]|uniref:ATP-dependent RNA helicase n=1 Tax=Penicillium capsulatum TaxID=69766 RepID=A0A9W9I2B9_9EURO|nr:ATP-dependent RNA helicase [Penicillium capsulatum]KAJ6117155.1 ATP-dependent RNA helicase [Penicillium capsulatum]